MSLANDKTSSLLNKDVQKILDRMELEKKYRANPVKQEGKPSKRKQN